MLHQSSSSQQHEVQLSYSRVRFVFKDWRYSLCGCRGVHFLQVYLVRLGLTLMDEHGNRGCKVGYVKVIADSIPLVGNRVGIVKSMHKRKGDVITSFRTQGTSKVTIPPRTVSETGQKNGITLELAYCAHDYAIITLLDGGISAYLPNIVGPDDPLEGLLPSDDSSDDEWNKKPPKKRKATDI